MAASPIRREDEAAGPGPVSPATIAGRYRIERERPLPVFDTAGAMAYAVSDLRDSDTGLYALVHDPGIPCRQDLIDILLQSPATNTLNPVAQEVLVPWDGHPERLVTVMELPQGPSLADARAGLPINGHRLRKHVVPALLKALSALHERQICHRAIRPGNVYFTNNALEEVVLGDCISAPPGADQPSACEPLERAPADRFARGSGEAEDEMFALGATLLACHIGLDLAGEQDEDRLQATRVARGSFWALSRGTEIPGIVGSLLRGLLNDDPQERWTKSEVSAWLDSAAPSRRSVNTLWTFARPVTFRRESYSDRRLLARDMARHPLEAARFVRNLDIANWMSNMITTELFSERQERLLAVQPYQDLSNSRYGDHAMVARVCAHIDPRGPVRFRRLSVCLDGIGPALAEAYRAGDEKQLDEFRELFSESVLPAVLEITGDRNRIVQRVIYPLSEASKLVRMQGSSAGLTRALYDLNPGLPCLSEQVRTQWIDRPDRLLQALDYRATQATELSSLLDAHVLAFFSSRVQQAHRYVDRLEASRSDRVRLMSAAVDFFAFLQSSLSVSKLPNLAEQLANGLRPLVKDMQSKTRRELTLRTLDRLSGKGDVTLLADNLKLARLIQQDRQGFEQAREQLRQLSRRRAALARPVRTSDPVARGPGLRLAAGIGWLVLAGTATAIILGG